MGSSSEKIWLERISTNTDIATNKYNKIEFNLNLNINEQTLIHDFLKQHKIRLEVLIKACWGLMLSRLGAVDYLLFGCSTPTLINKHKHDIHNSLQPIKVIIDNRITVERYIGKIQSQIAKKNILKNIPETLRYLLICKGKNKVENFLTNIDPINFPLILFANIENPSKNAIIYNENLFVKEDIIRIATYFNVLITELCTRYTEKVVSLKLLPDSEKNKILFKFNYPKFDFPVSDLNSCMHDLFKQQVLRQPDHIAITDGDYVISYKELDVASDLLAEQLMKRGVLPGKCICVCMERTPTWIMAILAIFKVGAVYIPLNPKFSNDRIKFVLQNCSPACILANDKQNIPSQHHQKFLFLTKDWNKLNLSQKTTETLPHVDLESVAYIIYTSGTTGKPKGVMVKHKSLTNLISWYQAAFNVYSQDKVSQFSSQGFGSHLCEIAPALALGASLHIVDDNTKLTPSLFFEWLQHKKITICDLTIAYVQLLFAMHWPSNLSLRLMKISGEKLIHYPTNEVKFDIWNVYGPTEATTEATYMKIHSGKINQQKLATSTPPIGKPIPGSIVYVVDQYFQPVPIGVCGELLIGGIAVSSGYINNDELTKKKFISNPLDITDTTTFYRTGDLVRWLPDGNLEFVGKVDNQVKLRRYRVELSDIENALSKATDVNEVAVILKENIHKEKSLVAYIVPNLESQRHFYHQRCIFTIDNKRFFEAITVDISKNGMTLFGITEPLSPAQYIQVKVKLPGFSGSKIVTGNIVWQTDGRCGIAYDMPASELELIQKSIDYHLSSNNVMELILNSSAKLYLKKSLQQHIPEHMVPSVYLTLMNFPLNLNGKIDLKALPPPQNFDQLLNREFIPANTFTEKKLSSIWSEILGKDKISMNDNFFDLGGTSLSAADLSVCIMREFKTPIPPKILYDLSYIPILAGYIDSKGSHYQPQPFIHEELSNDCLLSANYSPTSKLQSTSKEPKHILLTGASGFLGVYLLRDILFNTNAKIYCLIRKGQIDTAAKRLIETIRNFGLDKDINYTERRIIAIASDISFDNFGLPLEQYNSLLDKVDMIYHCGAQVNIMASYNKLRASNVIGTLEVIKFATKHYDKPIHYISTLSSAQLKNKLGQLSEEFPDENYTELFGGYATSKWVAERMLTHIKKNGLPVSIYRSGYISGDTNTGITNANDTLLLLIKGCIQMGIAPDMKEKIAMLPVDFVSKAIVGISLYQPDSSSVYHLDHPIGFLWVDLIHWINEFGYPVQLVSMKKWQEKLTGLDKSNALYPFLPYYLALPTNYCSPDADITQANSTLKKINLSFPSIDNKLLSTYFNYLIEVKFLPQPSHSNKVLETL